MKTKQVNLAIIIFLIGMQNTDMQAFKVYNYEKNIIIGASYSGCDPRYNGEYTLLNYMINYGDIAFDVGANTGKYTDAILSLNRNVQVHVFEPITQFYNVIKNKFRFNHLVIPHNIGLFNCEPQEAVIYENGELSSLYDRSNTCGENVFSSNIKQKIKLTSLDSFCKKNNILRINFLKIDVEGAEYDVLLGAFYMISNKKIDKIQFEYGGTYLDSGYTLKQVFEYLTSNGYFVYKITTDGIVMIDKWYDYLEDYRYSNFFATKEIIPN